MEEKKDDKAPERGVEKTDDAVPAETADHEVPNQETKETHDEQGESAKPELIQSAEQEIEGQRENVEPVPSDEPSEEEGTRYTLQAVIARVPNPGDPLSSPIKKPSAAAPDEAEAERRVITTSSGSGSATTSSDSSSTTTSSDSGSATISSDSGSATISSDSGSATTSSGSGSATTSSGSGSASVLTKSDPDLTQSSTPEDDYSGSSFRTYESDSSLRLPRAPPPSPASEQEKSESTMSSSGNGGAPSADSSRHAVLLPRVAAVAELPSCSHSGSEDSAVRVPELPSLLSPLPPTPLVKSDLEEVERKLALEKPVPTGHWIYHSPPKPGARHIDPNWLLTHRSQLTKDPQSMRPSDSEDSLPAYLSSQDQQIDPWLLSAEARPKSGDESVGPTESPKKYSSESNSDHLWQPKAFAMGPPVPKRDGAVRTDKEVPPNIRDEVPSPNDPVESMDDPALLSSDVQATCDSEIDEAAVANAVDEALRDVLVSDPLVEDRRLRQVLLPRDARNEHRQETSTSSSSPEKHKRYHSRRRSEDQCLRHSRHHGKNCPSKRGKSCNCHKGACECSRGRGSTSSSHDKDKDRSHKRVKRIHQRIQVDAADLAFSGRSKKTDTSDKVTPRIPPREPWACHLSLAKYKHQNMFRVVLDPNGGATTVHLYVDEIQHLPLKTQQDIAHEFIMLSYSEDENENAHHVMGVVHGGADYLPDLLDYMADHYGAITVKTGSLVGRATQATTLGEYRNEAYKNYSNGTFRYAPLQELSICGVQREEVGAYFPDFVKRIEQSPFMQTVMPWASLSIVCTKNPRESNDGPIFWVRPGEQTLPSSDRSKGRLAKGVSRLSEAREALFEDRTRPHADQIGIDGGTTDTAPTAAVGLLKAVTCGHKEHRGRATKDVVAFHAADYSTLLDLLQIDVYEPPLCQCTMWLETAKLNSLRRQGMRFARVQLHDGDVYYLPRKIIHQFQTISAVASVAWHVRFVEYFKKTGAPNLHHPTGLNKGYVYCEKEHVPVYQPPEPIEDPEEEIIHKSPRKRRRRSEGDVKADEEIKRPRLKSPKSSPIKSSTKTPCKTLTPMKAPSAHSPVKSPAKPRPMLLPLRDQTMTRPSEAGTMEQPQTGQVKSPSTIRGTSTDAVASQKPLKENIQFKKREEKKRPDDKVFDVVGDIMSQMRKAKKE